MSKMMVMSKTMVMSNTIAMALSISNAMALSISNAMALSKMRAIEMAKTMALLAYYKDHMYYYFQNVIITWEKRNDHILMEYKKHYCEFIPFNSFQVIHIIDYLNTKLVCHSKKCKKAFVKFTYYPNYKSFLFTIVYIPKKQLQQRLFGYSNIVF